MRRFQHPSRRAPPPRRSRGLCGRRGHRRTRRDAGAALRRRWGRRQPSLPGASVDARGPHQAHAGTDREGPGRRRIRGSHCARGARGPVPVHRRQRIATKVNDINDLDHRLHKHLAGERRRRLIPPLPAPSSSPGTSRPRRRQALTARGSWDLSRTWAAARATRRLSPRPWKSRRWWACRRSSKPRPTVSRSSSTARSAPSF